LLLLLLAGCMAEPICPPPADGPERTEFRLRLRPLVQHRPCPGPPAPARFVAREGEQSRREAALIERVRRSPLAEDYVRLVREDEEANRNVTASECSMLYWNDPEAPENVATYPAGLDRHRRELEAAEAAFARVMAACKAS
jgi:hypothetical protein